MNNNEGPIVEFPGMSVLETVVTFFVVPTIMFVVISVLETVITFFVVPTVMFVVISVLSYAMSKPRSSKTSSITTIE